MSAPGPAPAAPGSDRGPHIAVHVCGSVAATKAVEVVTGLRRRGCEVRVAMSAGGQRFVTPMTMQSLSGHPVLVDAWDGSSAGHGMGHLELAAWAAAHAVVAASANSIARLAHGFADDAVSATLLASRAPVVLAPAMEAAMWQAAATVANVAILRERGVILCGPVTGRLASGAEGQGRMVEPAEIVDAVLALGAG